MMATSSIARNGRFVGASPVTGDRSPFNPQGDYGLHRVGGFLFEEPVHQLQGIRWQRIVREMMVGDPVIKGMLFAVEMLIRRAEWNMDAADLDGDAEQQTAGEVKDFAESCLYDMRVPWEDTLAQILSFLPYGYGLHEVVYKRRLGDSGDPPSTAGDGKIGWDEWAPRAQETVYEWVWDDAGHATAFIQVSPWAHHAPVTIPLSRCLHFRAGGYRASPEGESVLRPAFADWDAIRKVKTLVNIGIERDFAGVPVWTAPSEYFPGHDRTDAQVGVFAALMDAGAKLHNNDQTHIGLPSDRDDKGNPLFTFTLMNSGGPKQFDTTKVVDQYTVHMTMAILANFLMVGHQGVGSFALAQDKTHLFTTAISAWLDSIANVINDQAIRPLLRINNIDPRYTPILRPGPLEQIDYAGTSALIHTLMPFVQTLNREDQLNLYAYLADIFDLPSITTQATDVTSALVAAPAAGAANANGTTPAVTTPPDAPGAPTAEEILAAAAARSGQP